MSPSTSILPLWALSLSFALVGALPSEEPPQKSMDELLTTPGIEASRDPGQQAIATATRTRIRLNEAPASVTVITREDILRYGYQSLDQALAKVPEVYTHYLGHNVSADFRGFWANNLERRVLYLLNGHRLNDRFHFGDFYPDVIQDLSMVERIEILRGPGAALYGSVAVLGVVNVITRSALDQAPGPQIQGSLGTDEWSPGGGTRRLHLAIQHRWDLRSGLSLSCNTYDGELRYDTRTGQLPRPWTGPYAQDGAGIANPLRGTDVYVSVPGSFATGSSFVRGQTLPNVDFQLDLQDFRLGAFLHSRRVNWLWFQNTSTFNHKDTDRSWGTAGIFLEWNSPLRGPWQTHVKLSYSLNTNREITDYGADQFLLDAQGQRTSQSLFVNRAHAIFDALVPIDERGTLYGTGYGVDPALLTDAAAMAHGGGGRKNYAGIDRSWGLEFQLNRHWETLELNAGGNVEVANYVNKQWASFRDGTFIGWLGSGGITDRGYYYGLWLQSIWEPSPAWSCNLGFRYDRQRIQDVYRQLGGDVILREKVGADFLEFRRRNRESQDFSPRMSLSWHPAQHQNLRLIYSQAFRAVPPQEIIRLPRNFGEAKSEITRNWEIIYSHFHPKGWKLTANAFYLQGNVIYSYNSSVIGFSRGSGWSNLGATLDFRWANTNTWEIWANGTAYRLRRASDAYVFTRDFKQPDAPALPNQWLPLDSPTRLAKLGASRLFSSGTSLAMEAHYNGKILSLRPLNLNGADPSPTQAGTPNYLEHTIPSSFSLNLNMRQDLGVLGWKGAHLSIGVTNLLNAKLWGVLNMDAQGWDAQTYSKPTQIPGFGRQWRLVLGYVMK